MFDVVPADDDQLPPGIDCRGIQHRQSRLARPSRSAEALLGDTPYRPGDDANQHQHENEGQQ
jgi:hypothetical protein